MFEKQFGFFYKIEIIENLLKSIFDKLKQHVIVVKIFL